MHYIWNTNFEWELTQNILPDLERSFNPIQFRFLSLPKIFAKTEDTIFPEPPKPGQIINDWGPSQMIEAYARKHHLPYHIPPWELIQKLASKAYAHSLSPLPGSQILQNEADLSSFLKDQGGPHVFKSFYGFSGTGHYFSPHHLPYPVLAEPWVEREFDFSTQWLVGKTVEYLGATVVFSDQKGKYQGNLVGDEKHIFGSYYNALQEHIAYVREKLSTIDGFFGNLGIDAFISKNRLQPICEINPRKTMGYVALKLFDLIPCNSLRIHFGKHTIGTPLLPTKQDSYQLSYTIEK